MSKDIYEYKGKPYKILMNSWMKYGSWLECVIYMCLYENPDGMIWVREKEEFHRLFKKIEDENPYSSPIPNLK